MPRPSDPPCPHHPNNIWWTVQLWSSSIWSFLQPPVTSSLAYPNILPNTLFSNTLNLCFSLRVERSFFYSCAKQQVKLLVNRTDKSTNRLKLIVSISFVTLDKIIWSICLGLIWTSLESDHTILRDRGGRTIYTLSNNQYYKICFCSANRTKILQYSCRGSYKLKYYALATQDTSTLTTFTDKVTGGSGGFLKVKKNIGWAKHAHSADKKRQILCSSHIFDDGKHFESFPRISALQGASRHTSRNYDVSVRNEHYSPLPPPSLSRWLLYLCKRDRIQAMGTLWHESKEEK
jgi:hypothetical protein